MRRICGSSWRKLYPSYYFLGDFWRLQNKERWMAVSTSIDHLWDSFAKKNVIEEKFEKKIEEKIEVNTEKDEVKGVNKKRGKRNGKRPKQVKRAQRDSEKIEHDRNKPVGRNKTDTHVFDRFREVVASRNTNLSMKNASVDYALSKLDSLTPFTIANMFHCCKRGNYATGELFEKLAIHMLDTDNRRLEQLGAIELSMVIQSLGMLMRSHQHLHEVFPSFAFFLKSLVVTASEGESLGVMDFDQQGIANIVHGLGLSFRYGDNIHVFEKESRALASLLLDKIAEWGRAEFCTSQCIANILHGCANMQHTNEEALDAIFNQIVRGIGRKGNNFKGDLDAQHLANMVWALGKLGFSHSPFLDLLGEEIASVVERMSNQNLSNIMYGFGLLGYKGKVALRALSGEMLKKSRLAEFNGQQLSNILYGLAQIPYKHLELIQAMGSEIVDRAGLRLFKDKEICGLIHSCALLGHVDGLVLDALSDEILWPPWLEKCEEKHLSSIVHAFGQLKYSNKSVLESVCLEVCKPSRLSRMEAMSIVNLLNGFSRLSYRDKPTLNALSIEILNRLGKEMVGRHEMSIIVHSFGKLSYRNLDVMDALSEQLMKPMNITDLTNAELTNIMNGLSLLEYENQELSSALQKEASNPDRQNRPLDY